MLTFPGLIAAALTFCVASAGAEDFVFGIGTHGASEKGLALVQAAGIRSLRDDIHWAEVEREKGVLIMPERYERYVDESLRRGIQPVLILCYGNKLYDGGGYPLSGEAMEAYTRFAEFVVIHFAGRVRQYEIWNEWNIAISLPPGTRRGPPEPYVALLRKVYPRLKAANPDITVVGGAFSGSAVEKGWLEAACRAGLLDSLDAFSFHPYCYRQEGDGRLPEIGYIKQIRDSQEVTRRYQKRDIPIYITEVGWPDHHGPDGSTPADSARFLARTYLLTRTMPFIRGLWWYDFCDDGLDPNEREHHFGIVTRDLTQKPAYTVMSDVCRSFEHTQYVGAVPSDPALHILEFRRDSGATLYALWSSNAAERKVTLEAVSAAAPSALQLHEIGGPEIATAWKHQGETWQLDVAVIGTPRVLETGLAFPGTWRIDGR
jgi:hypothetical protein